MRINKAVTGLFTDCSDADGGIRHPLAQKGDVPHMERVSLFELKLRPARHSRGGSLRRWLCRNALIPNDTARVFAGVVRSYCCADGFKDTFVHVSALERAGIAGLAEGQKVSYDLEQGRDGKVSATNLQLAQ